MKKIDESVVNAIANFTNFKGGNTVVEHTDNGYKVTLHGNLIAHKEFDTLYIADCGYATRTTTARLDAILMQHGLSFSLAAKRYGVNHHDYRMANSKIKARDFYKVDSRTGSRWAVKL